MNSKLIVSSCAVFSSLLGQNLEGADKIYQEHAGTQPLATKPKETDATTPVKPNTTPPASPKPMERYWTSSATLLVWRNMEENLSYAIRQTRPSQATGSDLDTAAVSILGDIYTLSYDWNCGVRANVGYQSPHVGWSFKGEYTYFYDQCSDTQTRSPIGTVAPYDYLKGLFLVFFGPNIYKVTSEAHLNYNVLDLCFDQKIFQNSCSTLRFLISGRGSWISQDWKTRYYSNADANIPFTTAKNNWSFQGGGLRAGFDFDWSWRYGLGFHFIATGSSILGRYDNEQKIFETDYGLATSNSEYIMANIHPDSNRIIPSYQLGFGFRWKKNWNPLSFCCYLDWEMNSWLGISQTYRYPNATYDASKVGNWSRDSISLQGINLGVVFEY